MRAGKRAGDISGVFLLVFFLPVMYTDSRKYGGAVMEIDQVLQQILAELNVLKVGQATANERFEAMDNRLDAMQRDMDSMKHAVCRVDNRLDIMQGDIGGLKQTAYRVEHELLPKTNVIYEGFAGQREQLPRLGVVEGRVDRLEDDMFAIRQKIAE